MNVAGNQGSENHGHRWKPLNDQVVYEELSHRSPSGSFYTGMPRCTELLYGKKNREFHQRNAIAQVKSFISV